MDPQANESTNRPELQFSRQGRAPSPLVLIAREILGRTGARLPTHGYKQFLEVMMIAGAFSICQVLVQMSVLSWFCMVSSP